MRIITHKDLEFPQVNLALQRSRQVGSYEKNGSTRFVNVSRHLIIVALEEDDSLVGVHRARSHTEAHTLAKRLLAREHKKGHSVSFVPEQSKTERPAAE